MANNVDVVAWKKLACAVILRAVKDVSNPKYRDDAVAFLSDEDSIWFAVVDLNGEWRTPSFWEKRWQVRKIEKRLERIRKEIQKAQLREKAGNAEKAGKAVECYAAGAR